MIQQQKEGVAIRQAVLPEMTLQEEGAASAVLPEAGKGSPIITLLGLLEGEILICLEDRSAATVHQLSRELGRTPSMVMMAVGALIREGLVLAHPSNLEVMVQSAG